MAKYSNDERVIQKSNGHVSTVRVVILEALEALQRTGATTEELASLIGADVPGDNPKMSIGRVCNALMREEILVENKGRWYICDYAPAPQTNGTLPRKHAQTEGARQVQQIAPFVGKRSGKRVSIYVSPDIHNDVIIVETISSRGRNRLPLWMNMRVCIGFEIPEWHPDQEMIYEVETVRIVLKDGTRIDREVSKNQIVTIAPEE